MFRIDNEPGAAVVRVRCTIDFSVKDAFLKVLELACEEKPERLVVRLEECPYMDCAGLSALVRIRNRTWIPVSVIVGDNANLERLFSIAGLKDRLDVRKQRYPELAATG